MIVWCVIILIILIIYCDQKNQKPRVLIPSKKLPKHDPDVVYLFCSGGYDSIYRLCDLVIREKKRVQPVYLNIPGLDGEVSRKNKSLELKSIKRSIAQLKSTHIFPLVILNSYDTYAYKEARAASKEFHRRGIFSRDVNQYTHMAAVSIDAGIHIETGILCSRGGTMDRAIGDIVTNEKVIGPIKYSEQLMFRNMKFPLYRMTKARMKLFAIKHNFFPIIKQTISCWFPENDQPCGRCEMCRERII